VAKNATGGSLTPTKPEVEKVWGTKKGKPREFDTTIITKKEGRRPKETYPGCRTSWLKNEKIPPKTATPGKSCGQKMNIERKIRTGQKDGARRWGE